MTILVTGNHFFRVNFGTSSVLVIGADLSPELFCLCARVCGEENADSKRSRYVRSPIDISGGDGVFACLR